MPTRKPTISESARFVSSVIRCAAASVSFITCGRGRTLGLAEGVDVVFVMVSPHVEDEARLIAHPVRRPCRIPDEIDVYDADTGNAGDRVLNHLRQLSRRRAVRG